jgi:hypothetical protein
VSADCRGFRPTLIKAPGWRNLRNSNPFTRRRSEFVAAETCVMPTLPSDLLRTWMALKLGHIKLATRSYLRDRTNRVTSTATGYAIAAGLYAAAGIFLMAACLVGATALFRWIEINYGLFPAFGAVGVLLLVGAAICLASAVSILKRAPRQFPSLASRLRVAIKSNRLDPDRSEAAQETASAVLFAPSATIKRIKSGRERDALCVSAGVILVVTLLGWAAARRRQQALSQGS